MLYLDNAATTKVYQEVIDIMNDINGKDFFNPSALYLQANKIKSRLDDARQVIAKILGVKGEEVYFTSGATEANNWAIFNGFKNKKGNVVVSHGEHSSVHECFTVLKNKGFTVRFAPLNGDGTVNEDEYIKLIDENTALISIIHRSNETGIYNDISRLSTLAKSKNKNLVFHSDGVQAFCRKPYGSTLKNVDLYSVSGHKIGAAKGIGALYISNALKIQPLIFGGGQEKLLRSGTENTAGIIGFATAALKYSKSYDHNFISDLHKSFKAIILNGLENVMFNTVDETSNIISLSIDNMRAEILQRLLNQDKIIVGLGSACAASQKTNRVLAQMGLSANQIQGSIRISFSAETLKEEIEIAAKKIVEYVVKLRSNQIG